MCDQTGVRTNPNSAPKVRIQTALVNDSKSLLPDLADVGIPRLTGERADRPRPLVESRPAGCMAAFEFFEEGLTRKASPFAWIASNLPVCSRRKN